MANDRFVYVTYIRTTPEKLWDALLKPEFTAPLLVWCDARERVEERRIVELFSPMAGSPTPVRSSRSKSRGAL